MSKYFHSLSLPQLRAELIKVREEMRDMPTSHSQSNPSYVLGMRSLTRRENAILSEIASREKSSD
jgi:hypothetical protein